MSQDSPETISSDALAAEIDRLRAEIARLEQRAQQLDRLAHEDMLVGLPNRRGFMRQLDRLIDRVRRYGDSGALLFIDIDGLKMINDSLGHPAGDAALIQVSRVLQHGVRSSDCVARLGGDEFAILLERADERSAIETASRLEARVAEDGFSHDGTELPLGIAIGVSLIGPDDSAEEVLARADAEMYRSKLRG